MEGLNLYQNRKWFWLRVTVSCLVLFLVSFILIIDDATFPIGGQSCSGSVFNVWGHHRPNACGRDVEVASLGQGINVELKERDHQDYKLKVEEERNPKAEEEIEPKAEEKLERAESKASNEETSITDDLGKEEVKPTKSLLPRDDQLSARLGHDCNLNDGVWEYGEAHPLYTNETCSFIPDPINCVRNGRPDCKYLHWRWNPRACDLPRFNAEEFLRTVKGKTVGFVGDSLARNQMLSLLCMVSQVEKPVVIYNEYNHKKFTFERHQVTLIFAWAPFLVKHSTEPAQVQLQVQGFNYSHVLHMDELEPKWTSKIDEMDIVTVHIGQWYFMPTLYVRAGEVLGCSLCSGGGAASQSDVKKILDMFGATLRSGLERIASSAKAPFVVVTTFGVHHFEDGKWRNGKCERTEPLRPEQAFEFGWLNGEMRDVVFDELTSLLDLQGHADSSVSFDFIDITKMMLLRADAHAGPYRQPYPFAHLNRSEWVQNDCLHWCMPGPVDIWNEVLFQIVRRYLQSRS